MRLPLDGNPNGAMGLIAHPGGIRGLALSAGGRYVLSAGTDDYGIFLWEVDTNALEAMAVLGGSGIEPFEELVPGGKQGDLYDEMRDYFYLAELRAQGEDSTEERNITGRVPLSSVPDLMRAFGYYPSKFEIREIMYECERRGKETLTFNDLIRLFVNHKPVAGISQAHIEEAFRVLGAESVTGILNADTLLTQLKRTGEAMTDAELQQCMISLIGERLTGREDLTPAMFAEQILGFEPEDDAKPPASAPAATSGDAAAAVSAR